MPSFERAAIAAAKYGCKILRHKALEAFQQHLMAEAPTSWSARRRKLVEIRARHFCRFNLGTRYDQPFRVVPFATTLAMLPKSHGQEPVEPKFLSITMPDSPEEAKNSGKGGSVTLEVFANPDGEVARAEAIEGDQLFYSEAE